MKKTTLALAMLALTPVAAQADLLFTVGAKASVWDAEASGQLDDGLSVGKNALGQGLNLGSEKGQQITVFVEHPLPLIPNLRVKQTSLELDGRNSVGFNFQDTPFSGTTQSTLDLTHTDFTLYWGLPLPLPMIDINFGLTGRQFSGEAKVVGTSNGSTETELVDLDFIVPMAFGEVTLNTPFGIYAGVDINYVGYSGNKLSDMNYYVGYELPIPIVDVGIEAGYRTLNLKADKDLADIDTDVEVSGAYIGLSLSFGL